MITVEIDLTSIDPATATTILAIIVATIITAIAARILEIYTLSARNHTIVYRSILKRNKMLKRPDLGLRILTGLILNYLVLVGVLI
jgi:hypothetical protein